MAGITTPSSSRGGYDYQFVEAPTDILVCTICHLPSKEPHLSGCCGHTFCKSCAEASKKVNKACPMCRGETFIMYPNKQAERLIQNLKIFCTNKEQGCDWQGELNNITDHLSNCLFQVVCCPNDCGSSLQRQYLTSHLEAECPRRKIDCQFCHEVGEYQFVEGQHKQECPKFPLPCPNKCEIDNIQRDKVEEHRKSCPLEVVQCDYHVIGCTAKMTRKELSKHKSEMMEEHLSLSVKTKSSDAEVMLAALQDAKGELSEKVCLISKELAAVSKDLATTKEQMDAMKAKNETHKKLTSTTTEKDLSNVRKSIQNLTKIQKELERSFKEIKDNFTRMMNNSATKAKELESKLDEKAIELKSKVDQVEGLLYDETVFWYNTLNHQASKLYSYDQDNAVSVVIVKMPGFSKNKKEWCTSQFHLKFRTSLDHQRMRSFQNSTGYLFKVSTLQDDHISVSVVMPEMRRKVRQACEVPVVKLLNQLRDSEHFTATDKSPLSHKSTAKQFSDDSRDYNSFLRMTHSFSQDYEIQEDNQSQFFIPYGELNKKTPTCQFLQNDIIFFEVSIVERK